jgi:hypothetical protein
MTPSAIAVNVIAGTILCIMQHSPGRSAILPDRRTFLKTSGLALLGADWRLAAGGWRDPGAGGARLGPGDAGRVDLRFRQVHLDFHTSEHIPDVARDFDPEQFAATLKSAAVDSVTCFGRCHHGYIYYDTAKFPERRHPHLTRNLLKDQIEACHRQNIRAPIYITVQWDRYTVDREPGWRQVTESGELQGQKPFAPGFYGRLCLTSPYVDFLKAHLTELFEVVPVDGLFLDIVAAQDCACPRCLAGMAAKRVDASSPDARKAYGRDVTFAFQRDLTAFIRTLDRQCSIFYNGGHVGPELRPVVRTYTHWEMESLPSGGWGYLHFPITMRYGRTLGVDSLGMTGKFHTSWGDFHSLKNQAALEFECFQMLALGAKCSVGDQLHPRGVLDGPTYDLIGAVYRQVERKEPWCRGAVPLSDIGVYAPEEFVGGRTPPPAMGVTRILQETRHQFDFIDTATDELSRYALLILPDEIRLGPEIARQLSEYLSAGGAVLASYRSGLKAGNDEFALPEWGVQYKGEAPFSPDFIKPREALAKGLPPTELVMYSKGLEITSSGAETLADVVVPYFNRTWDRYSSHRHTPSSGEIGYPGVTRRGQVIYFAHPVFTQYSRNAPRWCKTLVANALDLLLPAPALRVTGPTTVQATVLEQRAEGRLVVHLLHYIPERRGQDFDVIEDVIPVHDVTVDVRVPRRITAAHLVPDGRPLRFTSRPGRVTFVVPRIAGHQMIALQMN